MKKMLPVLFGTAALASLGISGSIIANKAAAISINEVCSNNKTIIRDGVYDGSDYIELYNSSAREISLDGWYLSDDPEDLLKYRIEDASIMPHGYAVFYGEDHLGKRDRNRLNFKIKAAGEKIFLSNSKGELKDTVYVPELYQDVAYARNRDGKKAWICCEGTPGETNNDAKKILKAVLEKPVFSHQGGFYNEGFTLTIRTDGRYDIYYTTDGSEPTEESNLYQGGISIKNAGKDQGMIHQNVRVVADWNDYRTKQEPVKKAVVIRAAAFDGAGRQSPVVTETFFVGLEEFRLKNVVSIVAEPEKLFGDEGIFVTGKTYDEFYGSSAMSKDGVFSDGWTENYELANFWQRGRSWEVPSEVTIFSDGKPYISEKAGIRVNGNYSRTYPVKDLRLISRKDYSGSDFWKKQIFPGMNSHTLLLVSLPNKICFPEMADGRSIGFQRVLADCPVFINGEHWYTGGLMERYDEHYIARKYRVSPENVLLIKDEEADAGEEYYGFYEELNELLDNKTMDEQEICRNLYEMLDMQSFIDWMCYHLYLQNDDVSFLHNLYLWRTAAPEEGMYGDCKWRFLTYDMDHAAPGLGEPRGTFEQSLMLRFNKPYKHLRQNEEFCRQFVISFQDMANTNFSPEIITKKLEKFGLDLSYADSFFLRRFETAMDDLAAEFQLKGTVEPVVLSVNETEGGYIVLNTAVPEMTDGKWEGKYFTDYPLTLTAVARQGWHFEGWEGSVTSEAETIEVELGKSGISLTASFAEDVFSENTSLE